MAVIGERQVTGGNGRNLSGQQVRMNCTQLPWTRNWEKPVFKEDQRMAPKQDRSQVEGQVSPKGTERPLGAS
jgi:hypothetical protein